MMNSPVLERMKGRYRKGILELAKPVTQVVSEKILENFIADTEDKN